MGELTESSVPSDPVVLFAAWFAAAAAVLPEPNAMVLATASAGGVPSARTVLLKGYGPDGFRFFTNYTSRKARDLEGNPRASLVFPWHPMFRQVRVDGLVERLSREESEDYFRSRPYGSRLGAWASESQSAVISGRDELERRFAELARRWPDPAAGGGDDAAGGAGDAGAVPLPDFWGGYRVVPETVEFWQGRSDRLHDRIRYSRAPAVAGEVRTEHDWRTDRLSP